MTEARSSAAHAGVAQLRIAGYSKAPVAERADIRKRLEQLVASATGMLPEAERIVLDSPEGMAVVVLADPAKTLQLAHRLLSSAPSGLLPAIGLSHGPVRAMDGGAALVGGALSEAAMAARFATAGSVLATRAFRLALLRMSPVRGRYLAAAGTMTDERDKSHELFAADESVVLKRRRRFFMGVTAAAAGLVIAGGVARMAFNAQPGVLELDISPAGEVLVDGVPKGKAPPLHRLELPAGKHVLEVRHPRHPPLVVDIELSPGERLSIKHTFGGPSSRRSFKQRVFDFFR